VSETTLEPWRKVWREFAKVLPTAGLEALAVALRDDDPALIQRLTALPTPYVGTRDWPCEGGCAISYTFWKAGAETVGEVEQKFADACYQVDQSLGEPAGCRWFLNAFDETPRAQVRNDLLPEVQLELAQRKESANA
jgi:hypothetical protein